MISRISVSVAVSFLITVAYLAGLCTVRAVMAHDRGDFLPGLPTAAQKAVQARGYGLYRLDARADAHPTFRRTLTEFYAQECEFTGVCWYETFGTEYDLIHTMPESWVYGNGVAGVAYYYLYPARIEYNYRLNFFSWKSTQAHETGHIDGQEDLYIHPLTCDPSRKWTRMSCGTGIDFVTDYDRSIVWNTYVPDIPSDSFLDIVSERGVVYLAYNGVRASGIGCSFVDPNDNCGAHFSRMLDNTTRGAVFYSDGGGFEWTGLHGPPPPPVGYARIDVTSWCWENRTFAVRPESALSLTWIPNIGVSYISGDLYVVGGCP